MARAETVTLLPLDRFAKIIGYHPLHFNQVVVNNLAPATFCANPLLQHPWQDVDRIAREDIAQAIADAEAMVARELFFDVLPRWNASENVDHPKVLAIVQLNKGYYIQGGVRASSLISAGETVVYDDTDADGYQELATITVSTTVTDEEEVRLFYPDKDGDPKWEIRPVTVELDAIAGTATITCRREQLVIESELETYTPVSVEGTIDQKFLETVDVYRVYNDPSQQVTLITDRLSWCDSCGNTPDVTCAMCSYATQTGCSRVVNNRNSLVSMQPGTWDVTEEIYRWSAYGLCRLPDRATVNYRAGWQYESSMIRMDPVWERVIARLAMALTNRDFCECRSIENQAKYWRDDIAVLSSTHSTRVSNRMLDNPLGTTRAAIYAWQFIQQHRLGQAVAHG